MRTSANADRSLVALLLTLPLLLPFAGFKAVFFGVPVYTIEVPVILAVLVFLWGHRPYSAVFYRLRWLGKGTLLGMGLFFFGAVSSFLVNPFSLTGLGMLKTWFAFPLLAALLWIQAAPSDKERRLFLWAWLGATVYGALVALGHLSVGSLTYDGRLAAGYASPNFLAISLAPGILLALFLWFEQTHQSAVWTRWLLRLVMILLLLPFYATWSYGAWIGVGAAVLVFAAQTWFGLKRHIFWRWAAGLSLVIAAFVCLQSESAKWQALITLDDRSALHSRMMIWRSAGAMLTDSPVFGIGVGRFQAVYLEYQRSFPPYLEWAVPEPHNLLLALLLSTGLLGSVGFAFLVVSLVRRGRAVLPKHQPEARLFLSLLLLYLVYGIFDTPYFNTDLAFSFWFIVMLCFALPVPRSETKDPRA